MATRTLPATTVESAAPELEREASAGRAETTGPPADPGVRVLTPARCEVEPWRAGR
jgi:hypothetical protein